MAYAVKLVGVPAFTVVGQQQPIQVCALSTEETEIPTYIQVTLGDSDQRHDIEFSFSNGEAIRFNRVGVHIFEPVIINSCGSIVSTYNRRGTYYFYVELKDARNNETLDREVVVVKVYKDKECMKNKHKNL
ncbi:hypothetical protein [Bacillus sp. KH172YL63]|uniref:hypothetical protein n=1 Tax=Bacillus sp. KH172YL63 TaxID=2709784 RepID=UPI0013E4684F|nr:hypothetical protein [Bacillus sp. KH172YL63]BCB04240.1 hypothetical protein KH172YL63_23730 [Bacillus sp. KH172YL63]